MGRTENRHDWLAMGQCPPHAGVEGAACLPRSSDPVRSAEWSSHSTVTVAPSHVFAYQQMVHLVADRGSPVGGLVSELPVQQYRYILTVNRGGDVIRSCLDIVLKGKFQICH